MNNSNLFKSHIIAPCKGCEDRTAECHSSCDKWKIYEEAKQEAYKEKTRQGEFNRIMNDIESQRIDRFKKKGSRKR